MFDVELKIGVFVASLDDDEHNNWSIPPAPPFRRIGPYYVHRFCILNQIEQARTFGLHLWSIAVGFTVYTRRDPEDYGPVSRLQALAAHKLDPSNEKESNDE